ncbi:50S ribosomal protein L6 [Leptotrichia sp. OH3620_COT-345]|uniref:50S ribosomal protein L6 n=1 Tax=Leptotrichia sp. OH3620_COT-345 TaxID=2491048 RepID=UPI000F65072D|nr:50S ribosomal protein L6 [Leptotrichia sp. OH3620_COT-345]RRD38101.1 50S ribosomal protein L6 [Leptotrichia sp. OH3620_COT-345]
MSRIGRKPISIPAGVEIKQDGNKFTVKGPKGELERELCSEIKVNIKDGEITFERPNDLPHIRALHGTTRANLNNMVTGVSEGFAIKLELIGVGYRVQANGKGLTLALGYSHPVEIEAVDGVTFKVEGNNKITVEGIDKQLVGQIAANIRAKRPPEPYKGKGVKYADEVIRRKEGKKG